mgnify:CR=1 FL=1
MKKNYKIKTDSHNYLIKLIKKYPKINSGRINYKDQETRIRQTIALVKKFIKN